MKLRESILNTKVDDDEIAIFYLAQAGFCFKTAAGVVVCMDAYFSDCCEREFGFKRMIPPLIKPDEMPFDIFLSTHSHFDHLDPDALPMLAGNENSIFVGAPDCQGFYTNAGLSSERYEIISQGQTCCLKDIEFRGIYADHGDLAPDAIGVLMTADGIKIYNTGDTAYRPDKIAESLNTDIDVLIAPINGAFGNLDHAEACRLAEVLKPKVVIASHFGMFLEHEGQPWEFLKNAKEILSSTTPVVLAPGERLIYSATAGIKSTETLKTDLTKS